MTPFNPDNWMDVFTILAVALIAAVPSWLAHRNHKVVKDIKNQVVNGHTETNLRNDVDRAIAAIEALAHDVRALKSDLMVESDHRRLQISDLRDELDHRDRRSPRNL
jgi:cytochrome b